VLNPSTSCISDRQISDVLAAFQLSLSPQQIARIQVYTSVLLKWNRAISLTTVTEPLEIVRRHFAESMFASKILPVEKCRLADVGSGAGFPGIALKIACPDLRLLLIESNKKKCAFLHEVVRSLGLTDIEIRSERFEQIRPQTVTSDVIVSRAVGEFRQLLSWSREALVHRGHIMLWVGAEDSTRISRDSTWDWQLPVRIPDSQRRFILVGRPSKAAS
jgi:16S rRNA (guanine527-N7)-methyltransferase